jgi:hypothetical protein
VTDPLRLTNQPLTFQRAGNGVVVTWRNAGTTFISDAEFAGIVAFCSPAGGSLVGENPPDTGSIYRQILEAPDNATRERITSDYLSELDAFVSGHQARSRRLEEVRVSDLSRVNGGEGDAVGAPSDSTQTDGDQREEDTAAFDGPFHSSPTGGRPRGEQPPDTETYLHSGSVREDAGESLPRGASDLSRPVQAVQPLPEEV